jgi:hypothetical protein
LKQRCFKVHFFNLLIKMVWNWYPKGGAIIIPKLYFCLLGSSFGSPGSPLGRLSRKSTLHAARTKLFIKFLKGHFVRTLLFTTFGKVQGSKKIPWGPRNQCSRIENCSKTWRFGFVWHSNVLLGKHLVSKTNCIPDSLTGYMISRYTPSDILSGQTR